MLQENNINLSIIIPVYNEEPYLPNLFKDLIKYFDDKQTELIIVDDGSNDKSQTLIQKFQNLKNY